MQALKALVIIMGVLIVVGTTVVVVTIYNRMNPPGEGVVGAATTAPAPAPVQAPVPVPSPLAEFAPASVPVPDGCRVVEMVPAGERLLLRLGSIPRCNRILVLDLNSGRLLGSIDLVPQE